MLTFAVMVAGVAREPAFTDGVGMDVDRLSALACRDVPADTCGAPSVALSASAGGLSVDPACSTLAVKLAAPVITLGVAQEPAFTLAEPNETANEITVGVTVAPILPDPAVMVGEGMLVEPVITLHRITELALTTGVGRLTAHVIAVGARVLPDTTPGTGMLTTQVTAVPDIVLPAMATGVGMLTAAVITVGVMVTLTLVFTSSAWWRLPAWCLKCLRHVLPGLGVTGMISPNLRA
jgi:hypothetical protein